MPNNQELFWRTNEVYLVSIMGILSQREARVWVHLQRYHSSYATARIIGGVPHDDLVQVTAQQGCIDENRKRWVKSMAAIQSVLFTLPLFPSPFLSSTTSLRRKPESASPSSHLIILSATNGFCWPRPNARAILGSVYRKMYRRDS